MSRPRPPYLQRERTRHGAIVWYVRKGEGPRIRIRGEYGSPQFMDAYHAAIAGADAPARTPRAGAKSLAWLIERYRESGAWCSFSAATRRQREAIFRIVVKKAGAIDFADIERRDVIATLDAHRTTPNQANHILKTLRGLFGWAQAAQLIDADPTEGVKPVKTRTDGHATWTPDDIARFEKRWPVGTRQRLAFAILRFTGLRRGDAVRLGRQHLRRRVVTAPGGEERETAYFEITLEKTRERVAIPAAPALLAIIEATPTAGKLSYLETAQGAQASKASFGNWFREASDAAGVSGKTAHGLRKALASAAAEGGASELEIAAFFGWRGIGTSSIYTKAARKDRLAAAALEKALGTDAEHSIPAPDAGEPRTANK